MLDGGVLHLIQINLPIKATADPPPFVVSAICVYTCMLEPVQIIGFDVVMVKAGIRPGALFGGSSVT